MVRAIASVYNILSSNFGEPVVTMETFEDDTSSLSSEMSDSDGEPDLQELQLEVAPNVDREDVPDGPGMEEDGPNVHQPNNQDQEWISLLEALTGHDFDQKRNAVRNLDRFSNEESYSRLQSNGVMAEVIKLVVKSHESNTEEDRRLVEPLLGYLWHVSASAVNKVFLYEEGVVPALLKIVYSERYSWRVLECVLAVFQNISEHLFHHGERNPNQVKLYEDGVFDCFVKYVRSEHVLVRYMCLMGIANLSMNKENLIQVYEHHGHVLEELNIYVKKNEQQSLPVSWCTMQPFVTLFHAQDERIIRFALYHVLQYTQSEKGRTQIIHALCLNKGIATLRNLARSKHADIQVSAKSIIKALGVEETIDGVYEPITTIGNDLYWALDNKQFSDVTFVIANHQIHAHKVILASRCPRFRAMFDDVWKESKQNEIVVTDFSYSVFRKLLHFIYTAQVPTINTSEALELLHCADMYSLNDLKHYIECYLADFISVDNCCMLLNEARNLHCDALERLCTSFVGRNYERVCKTEDFCTMADALNIRKPGCTNTSLHSISSISSPKGSRNSSTQCSCT